MIITNVTEIRSSVGKLIKKATEEKEPVVIMQRSKPVAYIINKDLYDDMNKKLEKAKEYEQREKLEKSINNITTIREKTKKYSVKMNSTDTIREFREK
jgi:antitoxin StbD